MTSQWFNVEPLGKGLRSWLWVLRGFALVVALAFASAILSHSSGLKSSPTGQIVDGLAIAMVLYFLVMAFGVARAPPVGLVVRDEGLEWTFSTGTVRRTNWAGLRRDLRIEDARGLDEASRWDRPSFRIAVIAGRFAAYPINEEALAAILASAEGAGLQTSQSVPRDGVGGRQTFTIAARPAG